MADKKAQVNFHHEEHEEHEEKKSCWFKSKLRDLRVVVEEFCQN
jgi:hypothetical protein